MQEQLITFDTAKLAREKGFIHVKANCYGDNMCYQLPKGELLNALKGNTVSGYILAPTQSLLQKYIREIRGVHIEIHRNTSGYYWSMCKADGGTNLGWSQTSGPNASGVWDSFEDALENALQIQLSYDLPSNIEVIKHWGNYVVFILNILKRSSKTYN